MQELTGREKRHLRGLGQGLRATCIVGKAGVTDATIADLARQLARRELIKVRLPAGPQRKSTAERIAQALDAACIAVVGRTALLYRPQEQSDPERSDVLP